MRGIQKFQGELGRANATFSMQRAEMRQGEAKFNDTEYAKHNALIEASMHASNAMRATEEINAQRDHIREVETSARRADEARSREVAS